MNLRSIAIGPALVLALTSPLLADQSVQLAPPGTGVAQVRFVEYRGPATFTIAVPGVRSLQIDIEPRSEQQSLLLGVDLPASAQTTWAADVEVVDADGRALAVRRSGIEWHKLLIPVPPQRATYLVRTAATSSHRVPTLPEKGREAVDPASGLKAILARWPAGRRAALSIRFDDSHPSHLSTVIPILREYGFRGTFMICPGGEEPNGRRRSAFEDHRVQWEAVAQRGDQEFANHSAHHRGAVGNEDMEREIGEASRVIWQLFPGKSKLLALNLGGGTTWETTRTLRYYLDRYQLFDASSGSLGMDDVYGDRPAAFRQSLARHLAQGGWCRIHCHAVGEKLNASEANFRATLDIARHHASELWIAGMADIYKYHTARQAAGIKLEAQTPQRVLLTLSCLTDPQLYDQPLTIDVTLPTGWSPQEITIKRTGTPEARVPSVATSDPSLVRFEVSPASAAYTIQRKQ